MGYDVKFQDLIEPFETVQVSTSPVATATSVDALGEVAAVGEKFAKGREAEVVKSKKRNMGDVLVYEYELKGPVYHELLLLSINKGKLYRLSSSRATRAGTSARSSTRTSRSPSCRRAFKRASGCYWLCLAPFVIRGPAMHAVGNVGYFV